MILDRFFVTVVLNRAPDGVLVEREAHLEGVRPHGLVEQVAAGEVEHAAVELEEASR